MSVMQDDQANEVLRALLNTTDDMICVVDADTYALLAFNTAISRHFATKFKKPLRLGLGLDDVFDSETAQHWRQLLRRAVDEGPFSIEHRGYIEGQTLWLSFNRLVQDGRCFGVSAFARDITQFERAIRAAQSADERFAKVFRHSPFPLGVTTVRDQTIVDVNDALTSLWGYERSQMVGRTSEQLAMWADLAERRRFFAKIRETGRLVDFAAQLRRRDGRRLHVLLASEVISLDDADCFLISFADITPLHDAELALRESELRYRAMIESAPEAIVLMDVETGRYTDVNANASRLTGYDKSELLGMTPADVGPSHQPNGRPAMELVKSGIARAFRGERPVFEWLHGTRSGTQIPCEVRLTPFPDSNGHQVRASIIDVSERKRLERESSELRTQLEQAQRLESLGTLAGGIAHDFNNILSAIVGYTEMALVREGDAEVRSYIENIEHGVDRARDLVKQILSFSRQGPREKKPVQVASIVKEAVKLLRAALPATIAVRQRYEATAWILADPTQVHQVVMNLGTNAGLAMRGKDGTLEVIVTEKDVDASLASQHPDLRPGRHLSLMVSDSGCGIAPEHLDKIFEPFFTTRPRDEGSGLGLSVVYGIVKDAGGAILVTSTVGVGTTFEILLPVCPAVDAQATPAAKSKAPGKQHVLFVDDDPTIANLMKIALRPLGFSVTSFTDPVQAMEAFRRSPSEFDVLVTDATMPGITGNVLGAAVKGIRPDLPMILVSGARDRLTPDQILEGGFAASLNKPYRPSELARTIQDVCAASVTKPRSPALP
jgi:PAS domain S-box-containing protein